jgi:hypothetical protein
LSSAAAICIIIRPAGVVVSIASVKLRKPIHCANDGFWDAIPTMEAAINVNAPNHSLKIEARLGQSQSSGYFHQIGCWVKKDFAPIGSLTDIGQWDDRKTSAGKVS